MLMFVEEIVVKVKMILVLEWWLELMELEEFELLLCVKWDVGFYVVWMLGEDGVKKWLGYFLKKLVLEYGE